MLMALFLLFYIYVEYHKAKLKMLLLYYNFFSNKFWNITFFKLPIILGKDDIYHVRPVGRVVFWSYSKRLVLMSRESE